MLNRRRFVYGIVSAAVLGPSLSSKAAGAEATLQGRLSRDVFLALRQQAFTVVVDGRRVRLVLTGVSDGGRAPDHDQFTVRFEGPRGLELNDGTWLFHHHAAGRAPLFVQRAGADGRASYYNVAFNLLS